MAPTVVLVHGAWHGAWCWDGVVDELRARSVEAVAVELPFTGLADDVAETRAAVVAAGDGAVVCGHSYGGIVVDRALAGLAGVRHVVYLAAFRNTGEDVTVGEPVPLADAIVVDGDRCTVDPDRAHQLFYGGLGAGSAGAVARLRPMVLEIDAFFADPPPPPQAPSTYVVCTDDGALPVAIQRRVAQRSAATVEWPGDHSPFLTRPDRVASLIAGVAGPYTATDP